MSPSAGNVLAALQLRAAGRRVLVAEDDDDLRLLLAVALRSQGYRVDEVSDGAALLEHLAGSHGTRASSHAGRAGSHAEGPNRPAGDDPFDLLISDLHIPCLSGLDVLASLRDAASRLPVILITADHNPQPEALARRLGAAAYFHKPFDVCDLLTAVINVSPRVPAE
jgi:two-component system response regulator (stage 0 sporulation protein F)